MAFASNDSSKETVKVFNLYTGVGKFKVLDINPTLDELTKLGFNFTKEPEYITEEEGVKKVRVQIYIQSILKEDLKTNITFFLENRDRVNMNGDKYEIINNLGQSTWAPTIAEACERTNAKGEKWFSAEGARIAKVGEVGLTNFLINWLNVSPGESASLDNLSAMFTGNFSELKSLAKAASSNVVRGLFKVRDTGDKQYQTVDSGVFDRGFKNDADYKVFQRYEEQQIKGGFSIKDNWTYEFQVYQHKPVTPDTANSSYEQPTDDNLAF